MKKSVLIFVVTIALLILFTPIALSAQEQPEPQKIVIKSKEINNGVVILGVQEGKNSFELQCNKDFVGCAVLEIGDYLMVRLPKNRGMYDCANVEVYRRGADAQAGDKVGQYCLIQGK